MFVAFALAFALAGADAPKDACSKLTKDFEQNERAFAVIHDFDARMLESAKQYDRDMAAADQQLAIAEAQARAVGVYVPPNTERMKRAEDLRKARERLDETNEKYKAEGDRITTLLVANKCSPPDHVTSWHTYNDDNPEQKAAEQASGTK